jgi:signal transduction histidine kinase
MTLPRTVAAASGYTILVVDDQEEALMSTRFLLEKDGHRVLTATSGEEALALFRPGEVQLIIVDYFMPGMSGEELVQEIRQRDQDAQILLQTGYSGEKPPREMLRLLDIQGYHDKVEGPERLRLWIDVALKAYTQLKKVRETEREVARSHAQLRHLSARLLHLQEEERERISRELHDHLGQILTAIGMDIGWAQHHCPEQCLPLQERLREAAALVQAAIRTTQELSASLRPYVLNRSGLEEALQQCAAEFARRSKLPVRFSSCLTGCAVPPETAMNIYRIVQEALSNVARHAEATNVAIDLECREQELTVSVADDGKGFVEAQWSTPQALGLVGMRERAQLIGGRLKIDSAPGTGTCVKLTVPLPKGEHRYD